MRAAVPVSRYTNVDVTMFRNEVVPAGRPAILCGLVDSWAARRWTPEYFGERFAASLLNVVVLDGAEASAEGAIYWSKPSRMAAITMAQLVDEMCAPGATTRKHYLTMGSLAREFAPIGSALGSLDEYKRVSHYPALLRRYLELEPALWMGPVGTNSPLHYDFHDNLFVQLYGSKRFLLFAPADAASLYHPHNDVRIRYHYSPITIEASEPSRYPRFEAAQPFEAILGHGETLYIPGMWWHHVTSLSSSICVSYWWKELGRALQWQPLRALWRRRRFESRVATR